MKRLGTFNTILLAALVLVWAAIWVLRINPQKRHGYLLLGMVTSPAYGPQSANPFFADHKTMQQPPVGTVVRHQAPLHYGKGMPEAERAGRELHNPFALDDAAAADRGRTVFAHTCMACHGPQGEGDGLVVQHGFPQPPSLLAAHARGLADGYIFHYITYGGSIMPSYATQITPEDRWRVIVFLRQLQHSQPPEGAQP